MPSRWGRTAEAIYTRQPVQYSPLFLSQETIKKSLTAVPAIYDIQAEINDMERELSYRQSLDNAYNAVFRELNEVVAIEGQQRLAAQQETVAWLEREVIKALAGKVRKGRE